MPGLVRIDVGNLRGSAFVRENDVNFDSHTHTHWNTSQDQCSMEIDRNGLAFACKRFCNSLSLEENLQTNPSASSRFMRNWILSRLTPAGTLCPCQMIHVFEAPDFFASSRVDSSAPEFNAESFSDQCRSVHLLWFVLPKAAPQRRRLSLSAALWTAARIQIRIEH